MSICIVGKCDVCGGETRYDVDSKVNQDGVFHVLEGNKDIVYRMCSDCAYDVHDYIKQLKEYNSRR